MIFRVFTTPSSYPATRNSFIYLTVDSSTLAPRHHTRVDDPHQHPTPPLPSISYLHPHLPATATTTTVATITVDTIVADLQSLFIALTWPPTSHQTTLHLVPPSTTHPRQFPTHPSRNTSHGLARDPPYRAPSRAHLEHTTNLYVPPSRACPYRYPNHPTRPHA